MELPLHEMGKVSRSNSNDGEDNSSASSSSPQSTPLLPATSSPSSPSLANSRRVPSQLSTSIDLDAVIATLSLDEMKTDKEKLLESGRLIRSSECAVETNLLHSELATAASSSSAVPVSLPPISSPSAPARHEKLRILVVDDSLLNRKVMMRCLTATGKECLEADDGDKAVERIRLASINGERIDVVLLDNVQSIASLLLQYTFIFLLTFYAVDDAYNER